MNFSSTLPELRTKTDGSAAGQRDQVQRPAAPGLARDALTLVLCGGRGSRLGELTDTRAKPAVPFGARYRIVDFTLANCVNSGLRRVAVLTQYKAQSLIRHVQDHWTLSRRFGEFIDIVPAQQRTGDGWYAGTADAVFQNIDLIQRHRPRHVLVLGGDHVYKMDYTAMLADHVAHRADATVACVQVPLEQADAFGVVQIDDAQRILAWQEKPRRPAPMPGAPGRALASMGLYVFDTDTLLRALRVDAADASSGHDFGHDILPALIAGGLRVNAHVFQGCGLATPGQAPGSTASSPPYWRDVGTLDAYWEANIDLTRAGEGCDVFDGHWPIPAAADAGAPTRFLSDEGHRHAVLVDTLVGNGCTIGAASLHRSVVSSDVQIGHGARVEESVLLPQTTLGAGVCLRRVIVDKHCQLPPGLRAGFDPDHDRRRFHVTPLGVTLITPAMLGQGRAESAPADLGAKPQQTPVSRLLPVPAGPEVHERLRLQAAM